MSLSDTNFLIEIARLYYRAGLSQQAIADRVGVSRPSVSQALKRCRQEGIVEIRIREPNSRALELSGELTARFGLQQALVVDPGTGDAETKQHLGKAAAEVLADTLRSGTRIGLSWGTTLYHTVDQLGVRGLHDMEVVQLIGALGAEHPRIDGFELARLLAERLHGSYSVIQAPALVRSVELKELLLEEPSIQEALQKAASVDLALVGISSDRPEHSALVRAGYLTVSESDEICRAGAVGHTCGYHVDLQGEILPSPLNDRLVGILPDQLRAVPTVIGIAGGTEKAEAILGTLRAGLLHILITDTTAARAILENDSLEPLSTNGEAT